VLNLTSFPTVQFCDLAPERCSLTVEKQVARDWVKYTVDNPDLTFVRSKKDLEWFADNSVISVKLGGARIESLGVVREATAMQTWLRPEDFCGWQNNVHWWDLSDTFAEDLYAQCTDCVRDASAPGCDEFCRKFSICDYAHDWDPHLRMAHFAWCEDDAVDWSTWPVTCLEGFEEVWEEWVAYFGVHTYNVPFNAWELAEKLGGGERAAGLGDHVLELVWSDPYGETSGTGTVRLEDCSQ
jgi:hypothetical protein